MQISKPYSSRESFNKTLYCRNYRPRPAIFKRSSVQKLLPPHNGTFNCCSYGSLFAIHGNGHQLKTCCTTASRLCTHRPWSFEFQKKKKNLENYITYSPKSVYSMEFQNILLLQFSRIPPKYLDGIAYQCYIFLMNQPQKYPFFAYH